ncbi:MAG: hypothetical protein HYX78_14150 [Armatimonadetes bacterium]|nr:hypothetical protein [Armatimonadota bacterium]
MRYEDALALVIGSFARVEVERAGIINALGRTLAEDVHAESGDGTTEIVLPQGRVIGPAEMGVLASLGRPAVAVTRKPRLSVATTGDELVDVMERVEPGKTRNISRYSLAGLVFANGCDLGRLIHTGDSFDSIKRAVESTRVSDALIITGRIAAEDLMQIDDALSRLGEVLVRGTAVSPGGETVFALIDDFPVFALPGEPVDAMIAFELFVRPALLTMLGRRDLLRKTVSALLGQDIRHRPGRREFIYGAAGFERGRIVVHVTQDHKSLKAAIDAEALIILPEDRESFSSGDDVQVMLLDSFLRCKEAACASVSAGISEAAPR